MIEISLKTPVGTLGTYMRSKGWIQNNENVLTIEKAGEGNMNVVVRITTDQRSFILKQSRPYVEKYQSIKAPINRISVEKTFYETVNSAEITKHLPTIIGYDAEAYVLCMEDLGQCHDMSFIYGQRSITTKQLSLLVRLANTIHKSVPTSNFPANMAMRQLNHQHIFVLPFQNDNGFSLDTVQPGLEALAASFKTNKPLLKEISHVGQKYLDKGNTLLHGDYYPGSWMSKNDAVFIIDPEFGFLGFPEFDTGVMAAHLILATGDASFTRKIYDEYTGDLDLKLMRKVAGIEIMRRLIGLAQLSLTRTLAEKQELLAISEHMILS